MGYGLRKYFINRTEMLEGAIKLMNMSSRSTKSLLIQMILLKVRLFVPL